MADEKKAKGEGQAKPKAEKKGDKGAKRAKGGEGASTQAESAAHVSTAEVVPPRLRDKYKKDIVPALTKQFNYKNPMQVPRLEKIVINMGVGEATADQKKLDAAVSELAAIAGQKPVKTLAKKAIAGFKIRKGLPIGCKVTLRKARMYDFVDRLVNIALPRVRDFRGLNPKSFDGRGNYTIGIKEHIVFPEIDYDKAAEVWGMDIVVCTTADNDEEARALLTAFNFPFRQ